MKEELEQLTRGFVVRPGPEYYGFYEASLFDCPSFVMFTANDCPRAVDILQHRKFEPESMRLWCALCKRATAIIDIGAQVGVYSLAAASLRSDIPIHAIEPNPYAFARLRINKQVNGFQNIFEHRIAATSRSGMTRLSWIEKGWISSGGFVSSPESRLDEGPQSVFAEATTLDELLKNEVLGERSLIKMDVEGAENSAIKGLSKILESRPDIIIETFSLEFCERYDSAFKAMGYHTWEIDENTGLNPKDHLTPADKKSRSFNRFLSTRSEI